MEDRAIFRDTEPASRQDCRGFSDGDILQWSTVGMPCRGRLVLMDGIYMVRLGNGCMFRFEDVAESLSLKKVN